MSDYLIADTHFNHSNIILYENRPFKDADRMNQIMIANWNATVTEHDKIFHLGDFALGNRENIIINKTMGRRYLSTSGIRFPK